MENEKFYEKFGYSILGPAILGYVTWIDHCLSELGIKKVFFFAREGQFIKRAFDIISTNDYIETYLYVSRRSLTIPAIATVSTVEEFLALHPIYNHISVKTQFDELNISFDNFRECDWYSDRVLESRFGNLSEQVKSDITNSLFYEVKQQAKPELEKLCKYLEQSGVNGKIAVADLGWNGSMQRALGQVLKSAQVDCDMIGFFLAQREGYVRNKNYIKNKGFLFEYENVSKYESLLLNSGTNLLEVLFCADHGMTECYAKRNDRMTPILREYEYKEEYSKIKICQEAAIHYIVDAYKSNNLPKSGEEKRLFAPMYRVLKRPTRDELKYLGELRFSDMNGKKQYLATAVNFFPIRNFVSCFRNSGWKTAFLKRNLHIPGSFTVYALFRKLFH